MKYIIFILIFFYPLNIFASSKELIKNKLNQTNKWHLTFSYGRALQKDALSQFAKGSQTKCQDALIERSKLNHLACLGKL